MERNIVATRPILCEGREWYVYFSIRNPQTGHMVRKKIYEGFKKLDSHAKKRAHGQKLIAKYSKLLANGWTPWTDPDMIYEDQVQYKNESESFGYLKKSNNSIRKLVSEFLQFKVSALKEKTYSSYQSKMRIFTMWLEKNGYGEYDITAIDNGIILNFFDYVINIRNLDKITVQIYKIKIKALFDFLVRKKYLRYNPVYDIPDVRKKVDAAPKPISQDDLEKLLKEIQGDDPQLYLACMMQYFCAIRPGTELRLLKVKHIDFYTGKITINIVDSKAPRQDVIDIPQQLYELLTKVYCLQNFNKEFYVFGKQGMPGEIELGKNTMRYRFNKYRDKLGLSKDYKFYSFKHTGAGLLLDSGVTFKDLMDHLRHHDIESTYHYIRKYKGSTSEKIRNHFPNPYDTFGKL